MSCVLWYNFYTTATVTLANCSVSPITRWYDSQATNRKIAVTIISGFKAAWRLVGRWFNFSILMRDDRLYNRKYILNSSSVKKSNGFWRSKILAMDVVLLYKRRSCSMIRSVSIPAHDFQKNAQLKDCQLVYTFILSAIKHVNLLPTFKHWWTQFNPVNHILKPWSKPRYWNSVCSRNQFAICYSMWKDVAMSNLSEIIQRASEYREEYWVWFSSIGK